jgi:tetratricopeptide (TPR) repeat protein
MSYSRWTRTPVLLLAGALASGCGSVGLNIGQAPDPGDGAAADQGLPQEVMARFQQAVAQRESGNDAAAAAGFERLVRDYPALAGPKVNLAILKAEAGDLQAARALLERATAVCSRCGPAWNELGVLERRQGNFAAAEQAYLRAIEADDGYALPYFNLGVLYELYQQRPAQAANYYERYLELDVTLDSEREIRPWVMDLRRRAEMLSQLNLPEAGR